MAEFGDTDGDQPSPHMRAAYRQGIQINVGALGELGGGIHRRATATAQGN